MIFIPNLWFLSKTINDKKTGIEFTVDYCAETAKVKDIKVNKLKGQYSTPEEIKDAINDRVEELRSNGFK